MIKKMHFLILSFCCLHSLVDAEQYNNQDYSENYPIYNDSQDSKDSYDMPRYDKFQNYNGRHFKSRKNSYVQDHGQYNFSSPYSSERFEGKTYPYTNEEQYDHSYYEEESPSYENYIPKQKDAPVQSAGYRVENDPPIGGMKNWSDGEPMGEMPKGEEGMDPTKEYQDPSCPYLFYRYEPEYFNEWRCEQETKYAQKRHCRYVPQYYQKRCCVYVPQYYYVTRVAYVPEYYYSAKRYEVPNYYSVPKFRYKKRYYYKNENQECQYLEPDDSECINGGP